MRAIIINAEDRTVSETDIDGSLNSLQKIVGGLIDPVYPGLEGTDHPPVGQARARPTRGRPCKFMNATRSLTQSRGRVHGASSPSPVVESITPLPASGWCPSFSMKKCCGLLSNPSSLT